MRVLVCTEFDEGTNIMDNRKGWVLCYQLRELGQGENVKRWVCYTTEKIKLHDKYSQNFFFF